MIAFYASNKCLTKTELTKLFSSLTKSEITVSNKLTFYLTIEVRLYLGLKLVQMLNFECRPLMYSPKLTDIPANILSYLSSYVSLLSLLSAMLMKEHHV